MNMSVVNNNLTQCKHVMTDTVKCSNDSGVNNLFSQTFIKSFICLYHSSYTLSANRSLLRQAERWSEASTEARWREASNCAEKIKGQQKAMVFFWHQSSKWSFSKWKRMFGWIPLGVSWVKSQLMQRYWCLHCTITVNQNTANPAIFPNSDTVQTKYNVHLQMGV